jgi:hypothetical protein
MTSLDNTLHALAEKFATSVMEELRGTTLEELLEESDVVPVRKQSARFTRPMAEAAPTAVAQDEMAVAPLPRRPENPAKTLDLVTKLLRANPKGLRSEELRKMLGLDGPEMARVLKAGIASKTLKSKGQKRATTYFAG